VPHLAAGVFARQESQIVFAGRKGQATVVLDVVFGDFLKIELTDFHDDLVANAADEFALLVAHLTDEVDVGLLLAALLGESDCAGGELDGDRNEVAVARDAEVIDLECERDFAHRIAQGERFFELTLLIGRRELLEFLAGVVSVAIVQLGLRLARDAHGEAAIFTVQLVVGRVVADDVVAVDIALRLADAHAEVVVIEQRFAAGIGSQRRKRFLRAVHAAARGRLPASAEDAGSARRGGRGIATGRRGAQTARVHRIKRNVGAHGGVDGGL
jgi:hypothetical protein